MRLFVIPAVAALMACAPAMQPGSASVTLSVDPDTTAAGEPVVLTLENGTDGPVGYNLCTSALEREAGAAWTPVPSDRVCTMELRTLEPGGRARYPLELPADLAAGDYRVTTTVEHMEAGGREAVRSDPIRVTR